MERTWADWESPLNPNLSDQVVFELRAMAYNKKAKAIALVIETIAPDLRKAMLSIGEFSDSQPLLANCAFITSGEFTSEYYLLKTLSQKLANNIAMFLVSSGSFSARMEEMCLYHWNLYDTLESKISAFNMWEDKKTHKDRVALSIKKRLGIELEKYRQLHHVFAGKDSKAEENGEESDAEEKETTVRDASPTRKNKIDE